MTDTRKLFRFCLISTLVFFSLTVLVSASAALFVGNNSGIRIFVGFTVSVFVGGLFTKALIWALESYHQKLKKSEVDRAGVPPCLTGFVERFVFTGAIALTGHAGLPYVGVLIGGWLALKIATNWQRANDQDHGRTRGVVAMLAGLISMFFAFIGGLIALTPAEWIGL